MVITNGQNTSIEDKAKEHKRNLEAKALKRKNIYKPQEYDLVKMGMQSGSQVLGKASKKQKV